MGRGLELIFDYVIYTLILGQLTKGLSLFIFEIELLSLSMQVSDHKIIRTHVLLFRRWSWQTGKYFGPLKTTTAIEIFHHRWHNHCLMHHQLHYFVSFLKIEICQWW